MPVSGSIFAASLLLTPSPSVWADTLPIHWIRCHARLGQLVNGGLPTESGNDEGITGNHAQRHRALLDQLAFTLASARAGGGDFGRHGTVFWTAVGPNSGIDILVTGGDSGVMPPVAADLTSATEETLAEARRRPPAAPVGCWYAQGTPPRPVTAVVMARGLGWGWQPRWMVLGLPAPVSQHLPRGVTIQPVDGTSGWKLAGRIPYFDRDAPDRIAALARRDPATTRYLAARDRSGAILGMVTIHVTTAEPGLRSSGLFNLGVTRKRRGRGIGTALTAAAVQQAGELGADQVTLNATDAGAAIYRNAGFTEVGPGQTWWLTETGRGQLPPSAELIDLAEGIVLDDLARLATVPPGIFQAPGFLLSCGLTPARLCAQVGSAAALAWLAEHGAPLDALSAWDVGWHDQARELILADPGAMNQTDPQYHATPLHVAAMRGDRELAEALVCAGADSSLVDPAFSATAAGWADHFGHPGLAGWLRSH